MAWLRPRWNTESSCLTGNMMILLCYTSKREKHKHWICLGNWGLLFIKQLQCFPGCFLCMFHFHYSRSLLWFI